MDNPLREVAGATTHRSDAGLSLTVVRYTDGPDRCTLHPPDASGDARLSTWLSANRSAFAPLDAMR
jgi:hypothetical protein